jgi:bifunctional non-homologous end joining protein LigD
LVNIPRFIPADLSKLPDAFDHDDFIFELKMDGFRALAYVAEGACELVSRNTNVYKSFEGLRGELAKLPRRAVIDGEIVVLDGDGRPHFYDLLRLRGEPVFYAFDLLWLDGKDLRAHVLLERKRMLQELVRDHPRILFARDHDGRGRDLFHLVCEQDLEGVVAKLKRGAYGEGWFKIRNPHYSQYEGRRELFDRRRAAAG